MFGKKEPQQFKYPGKRMAMDGNTAVIMCERESSDAAGAYPITPSTQMGEYWAEETAKGHINVSGRALIFVEPEGEHAAAGVTAGMSMSGLRASNFSSAQGIAYMHESLYAAVGKRLPYVLNMGCRAITKSSLNVHAGHDDYHCVDDTGFVQLMAKDAQGAADLNLIGRKIAELSLTPAIVAQDGFLTTHLIEPLQVPERELVAEYLGRPDDIIDSPTPAQRMLYGDKRRRIPVLWDVDNPVLAGPVENQDSYMQSVVAQRPYFFDHIEEITDQAMQEFYALTGRRYQRVSGYRMDDADYVILGQGSMIVQAQAVADYLRKTRNLKVGVVDLTLFRPFPGDLLGELLHGRKAVAVLERTDQPLAEDLPLMREVRAALFKCVENQLAGDRRPYPEYPSLAAKEIPRLYSGCYGLGSRDLQPEALVGAVENMLPDGAQRPFYYLSVDFVHAEAASPKQEIHQQRLLDDYPHIKDLAIRGSENPDLTPDGSITVRMHSVGGWGAITTGKNLAMTLFDLLGYDIKANPKYGSEKKGQPTTYYLSAAPEPIRLNCEYHFVDVVMSPDPNVFSHSNPLYGLNKGGVFIIQSSLAGLEDVWAGFPRQARQFIIDNDIRVFCLDGFKIAREEATNPDLQYRMQGNAFQGAFFATSPVMAQNNLDEQGLFDAIDRQLRHKFGGKGERIVQDNLRVVQRGFDEVREIVDKPIDAVSVEPHRKSAGMPVMLKQMPEADGGITDVHRFWEQTGSFYAVGKGEENLADPYIGLSLIPASSSVFRDMTQIRFEYPKYIAENCTGCGNCFSVCPDSAIPGLVNSVADVFETAIRRIEREQQPTIWLRRAVRDIEKRLRALIEPLGDHANVNACLDQAVLESVAASELHGDDKARLEEEFGWFMATIGDFRFAVTKPYYNNREKKEKNSGGLFSVTINPYTCKGCMECVDVCGDEALVPTPQTAKEVERLRSEWDFWLDLPTTRPEYIRIDDLDERIGALETLLLDKHNYGSLTCGDGSCVGCGEKSSIHLFTSVVTALMQPRVKRFVEHVDDLIKRLDQHVRLRLAEGIDLSNDTAIDEIVSQHHSSDLSLAELSGGLDRAGAGEPVDAEWLQRTTHLLKDLRQLKWLYTQGRLNRGRAEMGIINATGCTSVWGSTYPYNPYPFPWANHLFQDSPSVAMGVFQGHMAKMADGFKTVRRAEIELDGGYKADEHDELFAYFDWRKFSDEEWLLCPPVVSVGGDGAMYDIGFQNLSRMLMSGFPIKALVLDTQVYSNTGGQACTSGFTGQVSDMAQYGKAHKGKEEIRKEMALIGAAHRTAYVMQGSIANITHLLEGFIAGLNSRRPALFNIYAACQPEHGIGDDASAAQNKLAVESRAYPLFRYDPDAGTTFEECADLEGNPAIDDDWPTYTLSYTDDFGNPAKVEVPMTFADFAVTEGRFRKHFRKAPPDSWNENMTPLHELLDMAAEDREDLVPYILGVDSKNRLMRVLVSEEIVASCEDRLRYWHQLKSLVGMQRSSAGVDVDQLVNQARADMAQKLSASLLGLVGSGDAAALLAEAPVAPSNGGGNGSAAPAPAGADAGSGGYEPVWIETPECTACDECTKINPKIFAYNDDKKAIVINPKGGPFRDIVKAAEKCTAGVIHPGTPFDPKEKDLDRLIKRAEKYQ
ncbi:2-oxoacid:acceptor oxidoreductase family protein [Thiosocius teredinicola]|uniref:2-oxoacid:acceptor oxidoreductase family protein n=1 Tax=Thiosocius teredinicola TaxID=1973002 RepID=UPI000990F782